ncbi:MAG: YncE family protein [Chitinophagaceae bacterium]
MKRSFTCLCLTALSFSPATKAQAQNGFHVVKTFHIASNGGWDYLAVGPGNKLYVSHGTQVNILDKNSGDSVGFIPNTTGVHGIAFVPELGKGFTTNGRLNTVSVFELATGVVTAQIATGDNPDAILYDKFSKKLFTCNGRSKNITVIDPATSKVVATIDAGGKPETAVSDEKGKVYVNIEDKNEIIVLDLKNNRVENRWSLAPAEGPTGLAIDRITNRLFAGCDKLLVVVDAGNGKIIDKITIGDGCDGVAFDNATKTIFTSNGEGTMTVIAEQSANAYVVKETVATKKGARTIAIDETSHTLYLPTAEFGNATEEGKRPPVVPGTFQVLVIR